jgi:hypothetical protein
MGYAMGITHRTVTEPEPLGERSAAYVDAYLSRHRGLSAGELAFRLRADKRDLQRLLRDRSIGPRLLDRIAAYFGDDFIETVMREPLLQSGRSIREVELERERAEIAARRERLRRDREARRLHRVEGRSPGRMVPDEGRGAAL